jgi:hypothetical protein
MRKPTPVEVWLFKHFRREPSRAADQPSPGRDRVTAAELDEIEARALWGAALAPPPGSPFVAREVLEHLVKFTRDAARDVQLLVDELRLARARK